MSELEGLKLLRRIEEGVAGKTGDAFFRQIVRDIAGALDAHAAFTSRLLPGRRAAMLAFWVGDRYEKCTEYSLDGTPCEFVYQGQITCFARNIGETFPVDRKWFEELGVHSYLGIPIKGETGEVCGHLAVMDTSERDWREADVDILRLFSLRTAVELERERAHRSLEEANAALAAMNEQLRSEVEQRIVMEQQLAAAKLAAESANQAKSVFISQMSHELRTPLNGILGYAQLLRRDVASLTAEQREGIAVIERSGEHLLNLVNDLLDLAKIEAGRLELGSDVVALGELLQHVADLVRVRADKARLAFSSEISPTVPMHVRTDGRALRQVLLNLLGNAVKFTNAGGRVSLRVLGTPAGADRVTLQFEICDTGVGVPGEELQRIFEPFHRAPVAGRLAEGTGLGLAITRRLVETMGGVIHVASECGVGSTFRVELEVEAAQRPAAASLGRPRIVGYAGARRRVLVVDDDPASSSLAHAVLSQLGFDVQTATNGREALEWLCENTPALILTDLRMPHVDGIELARRVRMQPRLRSLPIVMTSASASNAARQEAIDAGCNAFLPKPLDLDELLAHLEALLELDWRRTGLCAEPPRPEPEPLDDDFKLDPGLAAELQHFALQGDLASLLTRASQTLTCEPAAQPFCEQLHALAEQYDTGAIRTLLVARTRPRPP